LVQSAIQNPVLGLWDGYDICKIPFVIYDEHDMTFINHPNPPTERPQNLVAATSLNINGVYTATLPLHLIGQDEISLVPIAYHEAFHVYQQHHFQPIHADFFMAMSHYPELDGEYRALCQLEADVLHRDWDVDKKMRYLAHIGRLRRDHLTHHDSLLGYERFLERSEGTAHYIEQKARLALYDIPPKRTDIGFGLTRFYQVGAGLCWLISQAVPDWMKRIEAGESLGDIVQSMSTELADLSKLEYEQVRAEQIKTCAAIQDGIEAELHRLYANGTLVIRYDGIGQVFRAFNPSTLNSLGDGRVIHRSMFQLILPKYGKVACDGVLVVDNMDSCEVIFETVPYTYTEGVLRIDAGQIQANLSSVEQIDGGIFKILSHK
ncbi:MAG: hypothetical protein MUE54_10150, partial [Anaerolineae bacterium]|nr:hypothetical protein [Anaerolineae bacterium]